MKKTICSFKKLPTKFLVVFFAINLWDSSIILQGKLFCGCVPFCQSFISDLKFHSSYSYVGSYGIVMCFNYTGSFLGKQVTIYLHS